MKRGRFLGLAIAAAAAPLVPLTPIKDYTLSERVLNWNGFRMAVINMHIDRRTGSLVKSAPGFCSVRTMLIPDGATVSDFPRLRLHAEKMHKLATQQVEEWTLRG